MSDPEYIMTSEENDAINKFGEELVKNRIANGTLPKDKGYEMALLAGFESSFRFAIQSTSIVEEFKIRKVE